MISRATFPALALLSVVGVSGGIYLGKAAVSEINPAYFDEAETRFHGDLVPYRPTETGGYRAGDLSPQNLNQALGTGCIGCRAYPEEVVLVHRGTSGKADLGYAELSSEPVQAVAYEPVPAIEFAAVERYTSYPVTQAVEQGTEAPAEVSLEAAEPVEAELAE